MTRLTCVLVLVLLTVGCGLAPATYTVNYQCLTTGSEAIGTVQTVSVVASSIGGAIYEAAQPVQVACGSTFVDDYRFGAVSRGEDVTSQASR